MMTPYLEVNLQATPDFVSGRFTEQAFESVTSDTCQKVKQDQLCYF